MSYQTDILKASTVIASHISRMKGSKYKSVVASGIDFERFYDKALESAGKADIANQLYNVTVYFKAKEIDILKENYLKDMKWLTNECLRLGGSMETILKNICYDAMEDNHNKVQENKQNDT